MDKNKNSAQCVLQQHRGLWGLELYTRPIDRSLANSAFRSKAKITLCSVTRSFWPDPTWATHPAHYSTAEMVAMTPQHGCDNRRCVLNRNVVSYFMILTSRYIRTIGNIELFVPSISCIHSLTKIETLKPTGVSFNKDLRGDWMGWWGGINWSNYCLCLVLVVNLVVYVYCLCSGLNVLKKKVSSDVLLVQRAICESCGEELKTPIYDITNNLHGAGLMWSQCNYRRERSYSPTNNSQINSCIYRKPKTSHCHKAQRLAIKANRWRLTCTKHKSRGGLSCCKHMLTSLISSRMSAL